MARVWKGTKILILWCIHVYTLPQAIMELDGFKRVGQVVVHTLRLTVHAFYIEDEDYERGAWCVDEAQIGGGLAVWLADDFLQAMRRYRHGEYIT